MRHVTSKHIIGLVALSLLCTAAVQPAAAGWFGNSSTGVRKHIGSAPNPTPQDIREYRRAQGYPNLSLLMMQERSGDPTLERSNTVSRSLARAGDF